MYCNSCGQQIENNCTECPNCGSLTGVATATSQPSYDNQSNTNSQNQATNTNAVNQDEGGILWGIIGCCVPMVGLILFLIWKDSKPATAKAAGIGALVAVGLWVLYYVGMFGLSIMSYMLS